MPDPTLTYWKVLPGYKCPTPGCVYALIAINEAEVMCSQGHRHTRNATGTPAQSLETEARIWISAQFTAWSSPMPDASRLLDDLWTEQPGQSLRLSALPNGMLQCELTSNGPGSPARVTFTLADFRLARLAQAVAAARGDNDA